MKHVFINGMTINASKIQRDTRDGKEVVILKDTLAMTLPSVMNRKLYTKELFANHYQELADVLAPVSHPKRHNGELIPASNPMAVNEFHGGASNENPRLMDDGRVLVDIVINTEYANLVPKGQELMQVVNSLETGESAYLATSTGLFFAANTEKGNLNGKEYDSVITACKFDHNAILINEQPAGELCGFTANNEAVEEVNLIDELSEDKRKKSALKAVVNFLTGNQELSFESIRDLLYAEIRTLAYNEYSWIDSIFDEYFIYEKNGKHYRQNYSVNDGKITLIESAVEVEKKTEFIAINMESEMDEKQVAEMIANALETQEQKIMTANKEVTDAQASEIASLKEQLAANTDKELSTKRDAVKAKFGLTDESVKEIGVNALDAMYAQTVGAAPVTTGVDFGVNSDDALFVDFNAQLDAMEAK